MKWKREKKMFKQNHSWLIIALYWTNILISKAGVGGHSIATSHYIVLYL